MPVVQCRLQNAGASNTLPARRHRFAKIPMEINGNTAPAASCWLPGHALQPLQGSATGNVFRMSSVDILSNACQSGETFQRCQLMDISGCSPANVIPGKCHLFGGVHPKCGVPHESIKLQCCSYILQLHQKNIGSNPSKHSNKHFLLVHEYIGH